MKNGNIREACGQKKNPALEAEGDVKVSVLCTGQVQTLSLKIERKENLLVQHIIQTYSKKKSQSKKL